MSTVIASDFLAELVAKEKKEREAAGWSKEPKVEPKPELPIVATKPKFTAETLKTLIVNLYLLKGKDHTVAELAVHGGVSESTIRKILTETHGAPDGCVCHKEGRASFSKNYRNMQSGAHNVWVYGPSRELLREMFIKKVGETK